MRAFAEDRYVKHAAAYVIREETRSVAKLQIKGLKLQNTFHSLKYEFVPKGVPSYNAPF